MSLIKLAVELENKGKKVTAPAILDTGAEGFAFIDREIAARIGLTTGDQMGFYGVGGKKQGFVAPLDRITLPEAPECTLVSRPDKPIKVLVGDLGSMSIKVLVGEDFMKSTGTQLVFYPDKDVKLGCGREAHIPISSPFLAVGGTEIPIEYVIVAVAIGAIVLFYVLS